VSGSNPLTNSKHTVLANRYQMRTAQRRKERIRKDPGEEVRRDEPVESTVDSLELNTRETCT